MVNVAERAANTVSVGASSKEIRSNLFGQSVSSVFAFESLLDCMAQLDSKSRLLLNREGELVAASECARKILNTGTCLIVDHGRVSTAKAKFRESFDRLLRLESGQSGTMAIPCPILEGHLLIRATPYDERHVAFSLILATESNVPVLPDLTEIFHLTKSEAEIVRQLFEGHNPQYIATVNDNSIHTIRAHIRRCYDKLAVSCREELWHKLNLYRLN